VDTGAVDAKMHPHAGRTGRKSGNAQFCKKIAIEMHCTYIIQRIPANNSAKGIDVEKKTVGQTVKRPQKRRV
jgi:hypothetical protein